MLDAWYTCRFPYFVWAIALNKYVNTVKTYVPLTFLICMRICMLILGQWLKKVLDPLGQNDNQATSICRKRSNDNLHISFMTGVP